MIESFRHKGLKRFYEKDDRKGVPPEMADKVARILARLDVANAPEQMLLRSTCWIITEVPCI